MATSCGFKSHLPHYNEKTSLKDVFFVVMREMGLELLKKIAIGNVLWGEQVPEKRFGEFWMARNTFLCYNMVLLLTIENMVV